MELASLILGRKGSSCVLRLVKCNGGGEEYVTLERFESSSEEMRDSSKGKKTGSGSQSASRTPNDSTSHQQPASRAKTSGGGVERRGEESVKAGPQQQSPPAGEVEVWRFLLPRIASRWGLSSRRRRGILGRAMSLDFGGGRWRVRGKFL